MDRVGNTLYNDEGVMVNEKTKLLVKDSNPHLQISKAKSDSSREYGRSLNNAIVFHLHLVVFVCVCLFGNGAVSQYYYHWVSANTEYKPTTSYASNNTNTSHSKPCGLNSSSEENYFQKESSNWDMYFSLTEKSICLPVLVIAGLFSDSIGRKPFMVVSVFGQCVKFGLVAFFINQNYSLGYFFIPFGISGLFGSYYMFFLMTMATVADFTANGKQRSLGFAIVECIIGVGAAGCLLLDGYFIKHVGYQYIFLITSISTLLLTLSIMILARETLHSGSVHPSNKGLLSTFGRLLMLYTSKAQRKGQPLKRFLCIMLSFMLAYSCVVGKLDIEIFYTLGSPFCWTSMHIGYYEASRDIVQFVLGVAIVKWFQSCLKDEYAVVLANISSIAFFVTMYFSTSDIFIYISAVVSVLSITTFPVTRGLLSKSVANNTQGALFVNLYVIEVMSSMFSSVVFNTIYAQTQKMSRGFVFLVMAGCMLVGTFFIGFSVTCRPKTEPPIIDVSPNKSEIDENIKVDV